MERAFWRVIAAGVTTEDAAEAIGRGLELWRAVGDRRSEGDATRRLSNVMWQLARGQEAAAAAETAVAILEPLPAGIELARAYANLAARRMMAARHEEAIEAGRRSVLARMTSSVRPALGGSGSDDAELTARVLSAISDEYARLVLTDPDRFTPERLLRHARAWLEQSSLGL